LTILSISTNGIGQSELALNQLLLTNYLNVLIQSNKEPNSICLYSEGVKIATQNSYVIEQLKILENMGSNIIICKTCVHFFELTDQIAVGKIGTMLQIIECQLNATIHLKP
jgi:intracellular sulfur oxidation DsrE/DsrF family protein